MQTSPFFCAERLPRRPYCTDDLNYGIQPRRLDTALKKLMIQINPPGIRLWMTFDVDRCDASRRWDDVSLPPPSWTSCDRRTGRGHMVYGLKYPVRLNEINKQTRFLSAVENEITERLGADRGYSGLMTKNPFISNKDGYHHWSTITWKKDDLYTLTDFMDWIDLPKKPVKPKIEVPTFGLSRNVDAFDKTRFWSYQNFKHFEDFEKWQSAVDQRALAFAVEAGYLQPLGEREVMGIAKSVGKWVWKRRAVLTADFLARQKALGHRGGRPSLDEPWKKLDISRANWFEKKKSGDPRIIVPITASAHS